MNNTQNQKYIIQNGKKLEASDREYYEYYKPIWALRKKEQLRHRCVCPKNALWKCEGDCLVCKYHREGDVVSLDAPLKNSNNDESDYLTMESVIEDAQTDTEEIVERKEQIEKVQAIISTLDERDRQICEAIMSNPTKRQAAQSLGMPWTSFWHRVVHIRQVFEEQLKKQIKNFFKNLDQKAISLPVMSEERQKAAYSKEKSL